MIALKAVICGGWTADTTSSSNEWGAVYPGLYTPYLYSYAESFNLRACLYF
ncbi:hypothetical protein FDUTEX481_09737 [Tolypothrix sp. PCC 7601]|nr:hypothetical protein FDUTEX481_09737 [Tolypothrix sp. PCC 7601]